MNYVERHFGDWARDTVHLTMLEDGAYNRLCDLYYVREAPLPPELTACCRLVRATTRGEREAVKAVLTEFFVLTPEGWCHRRCDAEIERFRSKSGKASASAKARWDADRLQSDGNANADANASPNAMRTHSDGSKNAMPRAGGRRRAPTPHFPLPNEDSVPVGTATESPAEALTAREKVWALGPQFLGDTKANRALLGKLCGSAGEETVADVLVEATLLPKPLNPNPWLVATCEKRAKSKPAKQGDLLDNPRPDWALRAGFANRFEAENAGCKESNAAKYRDGLRLEAA